jgi:hypothetical protein
MLVLDVAAFAAAADWQHLPDDIAALRLEATVTNPKFPGALLPRVRRDRSIVWYAAAPSTQVWRRLRPLLLAYAGPTVTNFCGLPVELDELDPAEVLLSRSGVVSAAVLVPSIGGTELAARALARLVAALARVPSDVSPPSPSTSAVLALLDMSLAAGDRGEAERCLVVLRDEWRLDAVNLHFMEVRVASAFREWPRLVSQPWFDDLCRIPKPPFVAQALAEALWHVRLEPFAEDPAELRRRYVDNLRGTCLDLLFEAPTRSSAAMVAITALEAEIRGAPPAGASPLPDTDHPPGGWPGWITAAARGEMRDAAWAARAASAEQSASSIVVGDDAEALATQLQNLSLSEKARPALLAALPELVRWLAEDPGYPRAVIRSLYEAALTVFTLLEDRSRAARDAMLEVLDALLSLAPLPTDYRRYLQDAATFVVGEAGASTAYWLIELAERLLRSPASDGAARLALLNTILAALQPITGLLTVAQRAAYKRVAGMAGWPLPADPTESAATPTVSCSLEGKLLALYTLTESAGQQARVALAEAFPGVRVELSGEHVCTPRLRALARDADLFVIATASAKHAATDCIQRHRPTRLPVAYATGRGATSILRAVEEFVDRTLL